MVTAGKTIRASHSTMVTPRKPVTAFHNITATKAVVGSRHTVVTPEKTVEAFHSIMKSVTASHSTTATVEETIGAFHSTAAIVQHAITSRRSCDLYSSITLDLYLFLSLVSFYLLSVLDFGYYCEMRRLCCHLPWWYYYYMRPGSFFDFCAVYINWLLFYLLACFCDYVFLSLIALSLSSL